MSALQIRLNRLDINLHGVSAQLVEQAVADLETVLRRRLQGLKLDGPGSLDVGELSLGPVHAEPGIDAAGLRALLVEQIEFALLSAFNESGEGRGNTTATAGRRGSR
jgi:hypothetical protein